MRIAPLDSEAGYQQLFCQRISTTEKTHHQQHYLEKTYAHNCIARIRVLTEVRLVGSSVVLHRAW